MITRLKKITGKAILSRSTTITVAARRFTSKNSTYYKRVSLRNNLVIQGKNVLLCFNGFLMLAHTWLLNASRSLVTPLKNIFQCSPSLHHQGHHNTML